ncbi:hypothetical protein Tco_0327117 [Tanacetum coccineum]
MVRRLSFSQTSPPQPPLYLTNNTNNINNLNKRIFSPKRFLGRIKAKVAKALGYVSSSNSRKRTLERSRACVEDSNRDQDMKECIEYIKSNRGASSSIQRSQSFSTFSYRKDVNTWSDVVLIFLSMLLTPTVRIHGASFESVDLEGPELPAEQVTNIPFCIAAKFQSELDFQCHGLAFTVSTGLAFTSVNGLTISSFNRRLEISVKTGFSIPVSPGLAFQASLVIRCLKGSTDSQTSISTDLAALQFFTEPDSTAFKLISDSDATSINRN